MIQHDMMLFDHGMPRADGTIPSEQRPEADVNIEYQRDRDAGGTSPPPGRFMRANRSMPLITRPRWART